MIKQNIQQILNELPANVELIAAVKTRCASEILQAIDAGITIIGQNYVQEAAKIYEEIGNKKVKWHLIGHLQINKAKQAVQIFDVIETIDSLKLAKEIDKRCASINKIMQVFIEINSAREPNKFGVFPEQAEILIKEISKLPHIKVTGLMTMGPVCSPLEDIRPFFKETKKIFEEIKLLNLKNVDMKYLCMGMSDSYLIAIQEGANMVRIGMKIFGQRRRTI